jgi:hypothetical protein
MKLIYRVKFRAFGITLGTTSGEAPVGEGFRSFAVLTAISQYLKEMKGEAVLVNERGVYIAIVME